MPYPTIELSQLPRKRVVLLSGFERLQADNAVAVKDRAKLEAVAARHSDAVAFGYFSGRWVPAA